jgi:VWFA-related protein
VTARRLALAAAILLLVPLSAAAQSPTQRTFGERIEVRVINLEAVVVDKQGQRVGGLGAGDFRLRVDGREVPIQYFSEIADGRAVEPPAGAAAGETAPPSGVEGGQRVPTSYLVFIDDFLIFRPSHRNLILDRLRDDLAHLGPGDRMAIVAFDGRKLDMLANWTGSQDELAAALLAAKGRAAHGLAARGLARDNLRREGADPAVPTGDIATVGDAIGGADSFGLTDESGVHLDLCARIRRYERVLDKEVHGVTATLRSFGRPPGRKVLLLLSGGWPQSVRDYLGGFNAPAVAARCSNEGPRLYRPIYQTANLLGYTVYPVDLPGPGDRGMSASSSALAGDEAGIVSEAEITGTLLRIAEETGGEAMLGGARLTALERVVDDTRSYYWIGFTPEWKGDDREHEVDLEVRRPGHEVRSRTGYHDLSRSAEVSFMVESALLFDGMPGARPLEVKLGPPGRGKRPVVPIEVVIPMDEIAMIPEGDHYVAELELRVAGLDESGDQNDIQVIPVPLSGPEPPPGSHAVYEAGVKLRREAHDLVISLYDPLSDTLLVAKKRFEP